jgi:hypothetical protein
LRPLTGHRRGHGEGSFVLTTAADHLAAYLLWRLPWIQHPLLRAPRWGHVVNDLDTPLRYSGFVGRAATLTTELRNELTKRLANARALLESSGERQYRRSKVG